jgi:hypothetical protein
VVKCSLSDFLGENGWELGRRIFGQDEQEGRDKGRMFERVREERS